MHGWVVIWHGTLLLAQSWVDVGDATPLHVLVHVAGVVTRPLPHVDEHGLEVPIWHWKVRQHGSVGHGIAEFWHAPGQSVGETGVLGATPCVVSRHWHWFVCEPDTPHVCVPHEPITCVSISSCIGKCKRPPRAYHALGPRHSLAPQVLAHSRAGSTWHEHW